MTTLSKVSPLRCPLARTLNAGDQIDGGEGNDTLNVDMQGAFSGFSGDGFLKNVENVTLTNSGTIARTFSADGVEGVEQYNLTGAVNWQTSLTPLLQSLSPTVRPT